MNNQPKIWINGYLPKSLDDYEVVLLYCSSTTHYKGYEVLKNTPNLSNNELASLTLPAGQKPIHVMNPLGTCLLISKETEKTACNSCIDTYDAVSQTPLQRMTEEPKGLIN